MTAYLKRKYVLLTALVLLGVMSACQQKAQAGSGQAENKSRTSVSQDDSVKKVILDPRLNPDSIGGAAIRIDSLKIKGTVLSVFVDYGGGCKAHIFELYANGKTDKSLPPEQKVYLKHTDHGDRCRGRIFRELKFDLSGLKQNSESMKISLGGHSVVYK